MVDKDKISAVYGYLTQEFGPCVISDSFDQGRNAHVFTIESGNSRSSAVVNRDFLERNTAETIPVILRKFLLAEHLRECNFPIVVTPVGLSD